MRYAETGVNLGIDLSRGNIEKVETDPRELDTLRRKTMTGRVATDYRRSRHVFQGSL